MVDSGNDKDAGRKVRQILDKNGWHLTAILNTHSNADHIGGNRYLQGQMGCKVYSGGIEAAFTKYPVLEPSFLCCISGQYAAVAEGIGEDEDRFLIIRKNAEQPLAVAFFCDSRIGA